MSDSQLNAFCRVSNCLCTNLDICSESSLCMFHCCHFNHNHCINDNCDEIKNLCKTNLCRYHCECKDCGHCIVDYCRKTQNICNESMQCRYHRIITALLIIAIKIKIFVVKHVDIIVKTLIMAIVHINFAT